MNWFLNLVARLSPLYRDAASALAAHVVQENVMDRALVHARAMLERESNARRDVEKELALRERELLSLQKTVAMVCYLQKDGDEHMHLWTPELAQRPDMNPVPLINALVYVMEQRLAVVQKTLRDFIKDGPTEKELTAAKQNIVGGFPLRIDSNRKIHGYLALIGFYRLPLTYLDDFVKNVESVSVAGIKSAFARRIDPD